MITDQFWQPDTSETTSRQSITAEYIAARYSQHLDDAPSCYCRKGAHAHAKFQLLLDSIDEDWYVQENSRILDDALASREPT